MESFFIRPYYPDISTITSLFCLTLFEIPGAKIKGGSGFLRRCHLRDGPYIIDLGPDHGFLTTCYLSTKNGVIVYYLVVGLLSSFRDEESRDIDY